MATDLRPGGLDILYTFPLADGTSGQVLVTDGAGTLSWTTISTANIYNSDGTVTTNRAVQLDGGTPYAVTFVSGVNPVLDIDGSTLRVGIGAAAQATDRLHIRAASALSTDVIVRVRDSADSANFFVVNGDGTVYLKGNIGINQAASESYYVFIQNNVASRSGIGQQINGNDCRGLVLTTTTGTNTTLADLTSVATLSGTHRGIRLNIANATTANYAIDIVAGDIKLNATGTKIGISSSEKLAIWGKTPVVQPTTGITAATFTANTSGIVDDTATFDGYTIGQVVAALRQIGILA